MYLIYVFRCRAVITVMVELRSLFVLHEVCPAFTAEGFVENPNPCFVDMVGARVDLLVLLSAIVVMSMTKSFINRVAG